VLGPVLGTAADAREWQRAAHRLPEEARGATVIALDSDAEDANPTEQLWWWAFCYVGLGIFGVTLALSIAGFGG
jgi:uncharacterized protein YegJ (DUF2314 family)